MPWEIGTQLHQPCIAYYMPIQQIFFQTIIYTRLDVVKAKPKLILHVVDGITLPFQSIVRRSRGAMFASFDFGIAQSPDIGLHCPTSLDIIGWQFCNVPMGRRTISLKHRCGMCHIMPCKIQGLHYACPFSPSIWAKIWVTHSDRSMWIAIYTKW